MLENKLAFSREVLGAVREICKAVFNLQSDEDVVRMFGIAEKQMEDVITQIINSLPDKILEQDNPKLKEEIKYISARDYIFFQVQERWDDPDYKKNLKNFIHVFSRDIEHRFNSHKAFRTTLKEEK